MAKDQKASVCNFTRLPDGGMDKDESNRSTASKKQTRFHLLYFTK